MNTPHRHESKSTDIAIIPLDWSVVRDAQDGLCDPVCAWETERNTPHRKNELRSAACRIAAAFGSRFANRLNEARRLARHTAALGIAVLSLCATVPAYAQANRQCAAGNAQSPIQGPALNGGYFQTSADLGRAANPAAPLLRYGTGANGAIVITGNIGWTEASPPANNDRTRITILVGGVAYASFVSGQFVGGAGTVTGLNGATATWNGTSFASAGPPRPFTITLPLAVTQVLGNNALTVHYDDLERQEGDDWAFNNINTLECNSRLAVTKATLGGAGRLGTEQFTLAITGSNQTAASSYTTGGTGTAVTGGPGVVQWFDAGTQYTLRETISANAGVYDTTLACVNAAVVATGTVLPSGTGTNFSVAPRAGDNITCTFTNTRISQNLNLVKNWVNAAAGHTATATTTGGTNAATFNSTAPTNTVGTAVVVSAGNVVTLPAETFGGGAANGDYDVTVACTGGTTLAASAPPQTITIANNATATTCTYTNTRRRATLQTAKAWAPGSIAGHQVTIGATTGGTNNTASFNAVAPTASNSGAAVAVAVGDAITLPAETGTNVANYTTTLACTGGHVLSGTNGQQANTLTINSANAAVCTYTNTLRTANLTMRKQWSGAAVGDDATITVTRGAAVIDTFDSDAGTAGELDTVVAPVQVFGGETVNLAEALAPANAGVYDTTLACTGTADANPADGLTIGAADTAIVCTYTNTRRSADLSITKTNTPAAGALDQANDTVDAAQATTYTLVVTNDGTTEVTGAVVRDAPGAGITCASGNPVTITGVGVPAGSFTVADLTGANGIVLGALAAGQSTTLSFTCQVN